MWTVSYRCALMVMTVSNFVTNFSVSIDKNQFKNYPPRTKKKKKKKKTGILSICGNRNWGRMNQFLVEYIIINNYMHADRRRIHTHSQTVNIIIVALHLDRVFICTVIMFMKSSRSGQWEQQRRHRTNSFGRELRAYRYMCAVCSTSTTTCSTQRYT